MDWHKTRSRAARKQLEDVLRWVGVSTPLMQGIRRSTGGIRLLREVVLIATAAWGATVASIRIEEVKAHEGATDPAPSIAARVANALKLGQIASLGRVARLRSRPFARRGVSQAVPLGPDEWRRGDG